MRIIRNAYDNKLATITRTVTNTDFSTHRSRAKFFWLALVLLLAALVLTLRITGPSDLDQKDQPKTVAYTADMILHGRYIWPRDMLGYPATKPPLYNWLSIPFVLVTGQWNETILKMPTILAGLGIVAITWLAAKNLFTEKSGLKHEKTSEAQWALPALAASMFLANAAVYRLIYIARPDMLLSFFLVASWLLATKCLQADESQKSNNAWLKIMLWVCVGCAALTKGPPALLVVLYIPLAAKLIHGSWRASLRTGILWGLPLSLVIFSCWALPAWLTVTNQWREHLYEVERNRVAKTTLLKWALSIYEMPVAFVGRFHFWAALFIAALVVIKPRNWFSHRTAPAILWTLLVIVFFTIPRLRRDDYLLPAYATAAVVAAWFVLELARKIQGKNIRAARMIPDGIWIIALLYCLISGLNDRTLKPQTHDRLGDHVTQFAAEIRSVVPRDERDKIVFLDTGYHQLQTLLGLNQASVLPDETAMKNARWIVQPIDREKEKKAAAISLPLPRVINDSQAAPLGLYRAEKNR